MLTDIHHAFLLRNPTIKSQNVRIIRLSGIFVIAHFAVPCSQRLLGNDELHDEHDGMTS